MAKLAQPGNQEKKIVVACLSKCKNDINMDVEAAIAINLNTILLLFLYTFILKPELSQIQAYSMLL